MQFGIELLSIKMRVPIILKEDFDKIKYQRSVTQSRKLPFFCGVEERLIVDKVRSYPIYVKLKAITQTRNHWDQGDRHTRILGVGYC